MEAGHRFKYRHLFDMTKHANRLLEDKSLLWPSISRELDLAAPVDG